MERINKKYISVIVAVIICALPLVTSAALVPCGDGDPRECNWSKLIELANRILSFLIAIGTLILAVVISWAGIQLMLSRKNPGKRTEARKMVTDAVIGLSIMLLAFLIVKLILNGLGAVIRPQGL